MINWLRRLWRDSEPRCPDELFRPEPVLNAEWLLTFTWVGSAEPHHTERYYTLTEADHEMSVSLPDIDSWIIVQLIKPDGTILKSEVGYAR